MPVFTANIPHPLKIGDRIEIGGKIKENARKMSVNLCAQEGEEPKDVVLHFDVRFHRDNIISLSRKNGVWIGSGNYDTNYNMFVPGTIFRIIFEIKDTDVVTIYCQGKFHSNFLPKIPLCMARYVVVWADVDRITHCYFHTCQLVGGEVPQMDPKLTLNPMSLDKKRNTQTRERHNTRRLSNESLDVKKNNKCEARADKYFYDTLICQQDGHKYRIEEKQKYIESASEETDSKMAATESGSDSEVLSGVKKRDRRGRFGSFGHVVNFMHRSSRRI